MSDHTYTAENPCPECGNPGFFSVHFPCCTACANSKPRPRERTLEKPKPALWERFCNLFPEIM